MYKFEETMNEWGAENLDDTNLHKDFVADARDFLSKVENKELNDDEINEKDLNLVEYFNELHKSEAERKLEETEAAKEALSAENLQIKKDNIIKQAQIDISKETNLENLEKLKVTYKETPEALNVIQVKIDAVKSKIATDKAAADKIKADKEEADRKVAAKKAEEDKKRVPKTKEELEAEWKKKAIEGLKTLASMKGYYATYDDLRAIGIKPSGDDMEIFGYKLIRRAFFKVYQVIAPPEPEKKED